MGLHKAPWKSLVKLDMFKLHLNKSQQVKKQNEEQGYSDKQDVCDYWNTDHRTDLLWSDGSRKNFVPWKTFSGQQIGLYYVLDTENISICGGKTWEAAVARET